MEAAMVGNLPPLFKLFLKFAARGNCSRIETRRDGVGDQIMIFPDDRIADMGTDGLRNVFHSVDRDLDLRGECVSAEEEGNHAQDENPGRGLNEQ